MAWGLQWWQILQGTNPQGTIDPLVLRNRLSCQWNLLGPLQGAYQQYPWHSSRRPGVDRCIGGWAGAFRGRRFSCALVVAMPESDPEMMAMFSWTAVRVGLEWRPPLHPEPLRLANWFLGVVCAGSQRLSSQRCMGSLPVRGRHFFTARNRPASSSSLTTLDGPRDADKVWFLKVPVSQTGLFGDAVKNGICER